MRILYCCCQGKTADCKAVLFIVNLLIWAAVVDAVVLLGSDRNLTGKAGYIVGQANTVISVRVCIRSTGSGRRKSGRSTGSVLRSTAGISARLWALPVPVSQPS